MTPTITEESGRMTTAATLIATSPVDGEELFFYFVLLNLFLNLGIYNGAMGISFFSPLFSGFLNDCLQLDYVYGTMITTTNGYLQTPLIGESEMHMHLEPWVCFFRFFFWFTK
jgi:hypothetical protein